MEFALLERLQRLDDARPSIPGEHWMTLGVGLWLLARRPASPLGRLACAAAGVALIYRAASGRDGLVRRIARGPMRRWTDRAGARRAHERYIDLAAPWPYTKRVRVAAISQPLGTRTMSTP
jgi:hypothetical protein